MNLHSPLKSLQFKQLFEINPLIMINKKLSGVFVKLASLVLVFSFLLTPLSVVFAQEVSTPPPAPTEEVPAQPEGKVLGTETPDSSTPEETTPESTIPSEEDKIKEEKPAKEKPKEEKPKGEEPILEMMAQGAVGPVDLIGDISESKVGRLSSQVDNTSGALVYRYDVVVPPGRNGMTPELALIYRSTNSAQDSVVGSGWNFNIPYIQRVNKKGSDKLYTDNYFVSSLDGELILVSGNTYAPKYENGDFRKYNLISNVWTVTDKTGTVFTFGTTASARQDNPSDSSKIYKWMLEEIRDTNDNYISYEYYKDAGQIYPAVITYTGNNTTDGIFDINFVRVSRSGAPVMFDAGFSVQSNYRISEVNTEISDSWVRKYTLSYTTGDNNIGSFLDTIIESGRDESAVTTTLPAVNFDYSTSATDWTYNSSLAIALPFTESGTDYGMRTADINGDGLLDILCHNGKSGGNCSKNNSLFFLNTGDGWTDVSSTWDFPVTQANLSGDQEYFVENDGSDAGLRAIDVNGDLKVDLVKGKVGVGKFVYINNGSGWTYDATWDLPYAFVAAGGEDFGMRMGDINGDGLPDIVCHNDKTSGVSCPRSQPQVYLNNGSGWTDVSSTWLIPIIENNPPLREYFTNDGLADAGLRLVDVNGDGLADLVRANDSAKYTYINNGSGWTYDADWNMPLSFIYSGTDPGLRMADVNGDGLIDVLCHNLSTATGVCTRDHPYIHLNNGNGWDDVSATWEFPVAQDNSPYKEAFLTSSFTDTGLRILDINGDGIDDFVRGSGSSKYTYTNNEDIPANLLTNITYPQGGNTSITYKATPLFLNSSGSLLNPNMPIIFHAVSQVSTSDGIATTIQNEYKYTGGGYYFDDYLDRKFAGFSTIIKTDSEGNVKKTYYHQGNATNTTLGEYDDHVSKIGKAYRLEEYDNSSNLYRLSVDKIDKYNIGTDHDFVKVIRHTTLDYDGDPDHADTTSEYTYDNTYGNLTQHVNWGKVTASTDGSFTDTGSDKMTRDISYTSNTTDYIVGLPYQDTVTDQSAAKVRESKTYYDTQSLGSVTIGNPTKVEDWVLGSTYINNQKTYDGTYGLVATATDPRGKVTTYTTYDTYNLYPITITNPLSQTLQYTYDYSLGKPKQTTDQNGFVYQTVYDGLDRVTEEKIPGFTSPYTPVAKTAYAYTDTSGAVKVQRTNHLDGSTSVDTHQYFDGLGRLIQERKEAESNYNVKDTVYNNVGLIQKQSLPYNSSGSSKTSATGTTSLYKNYTYDALKRPKTIIDAVGTTSYAYDDWKTIVTDAANNVKHYYKDARENLIKVDEVNGASTYTTNYEWNLNNKLTKITDALSNVRNFTYDGLGRRLTAEDLHAPADGSYGTWTYVYDDAGNLTQSISPRSLTTNYTYNDINQQLTEDYTGAGGTEITYTYSGCTNGTAKLCSITMTSGANTVYTYDSNGNVASEAKTINSTAYTTSYIYDRQGNKLVITYPDSAEVKYTFNSAGLLNKIERKESGGSFTDVVSNFDYSPLDQITTQEYANGQITTNVYDATKSYRLTRKETTSSGGGGSSTTVTFYPSAGDGYVYGDNSNWDTIHDATSASYAPYTGTAIYAANGKSSSTNYRIRRTFIPFDTSSLPDGATITDAKLKVYVSSKLNNDNDGDDWLTVLQTTQPSTTSLSGADFDLVGSINSPTEGIDTGERKDITSISTSAYLTFNLNATGRGWINDTGFTKLGIREGHDVIDSPFIGSSGQYNYIIFRGSEYSGTTYDPILEITYTEGSGGTLQDLNYTYDSVGNITGINEQSDTDAAREVNYTYDDLYRLTQYSRAVVGGPSGNWFNNSWNYRIKVTIPSGKVSSDLTNFPVYVNLSNLPSGFHTNVKSDGGDIRVTKSDGTTELPREVTNYNSSTDTGELHVLYNGTLQSGQNNEFYIYYGNSAASDYASTDTYGSRAVWANYNFVSHEGAISDATGNHSPSNNGTTQSSDAKLGPTSRDYESSSSQYITVSDSSLLDLVGNFSLEGWFKFESLTSGGYFIWSHYDAPNSFTDIYYNADNDRIFISSINAGSWSLSAYTTYSFIPGQWYHLAMQGPAGGGGSQGDWKVFVNGTALGALSMDVGSWSNTWGNKSATINIGRHGSSSSYLDGLMDEFRLKSELLSASWIGAEYSNQGDPSTFYSIGSQESREGGGGSFDTQNFTYDAIGNISSGPIGSYTYTGTNYANPHAATSINGVTYTYDNDGNLTGNGTLANTFNYKDQMTQAVVGVVTSNYTYDHNGERASLANGTTTIAYANDLYNYDGTKKTKQVYDNKGNLLATLETVSGTVTIFYNHVDHLGSVNTTSNSSGALVTTMDYYPYGDTRISSSPGQRQFVGEIYDTDTGLNYLNARYYKSDIGRFISEDSMFWQLPQELLADPQQQNSYSYARNNPIVMKDPSGLLTIVIPGTFYSEDDWSFSGDAKNFITSVGQTFGDTKQGENLKILGWSGGNSDEARSEAAASLANMVKDYKFADGEKLNIVGHSHGGNIGIEASKGIGRNVDTLVTLGTPNRTTHQPGENVDRHINVYSRLDPFQKVGGVGDPLTIRGADSRQFKGAENINATLNAGLVNPHSSLWKKSGAWSKVDKKINKK